MDMQITVKVTKHKNGPFVIMTKNLDYKDKDIQIIGPPGGYRTKDEALMFLNKLKEKEISFFGVELEIVPLRTEANYMRYISW